MKWIAGIVALLIPVLAQAQTIAFADIPKEIIARADSYIISHVGEAYFKENYKISGESTGEVKTARGKEVREYQIKYHYLPIAKIGATELLTVKVQDTPDYQPGDYIANIRGKKVIDPTVAASTAINAAHRLIGEEGYRSRLCRKLELSGSPTATLTHPWFQTDAREPWIWNVSFPLSEESVCGAHASYVVKVDASTGEIRSHHPFGTR